MDILGKVVFMEHSLPVYGSLDEPLFRASDVAAVIDYSDGNVWKMLEKIGTDKQILFTLMRKPIC